MTEVALLMFNSSKRTPFVIRCKTRSIFPLDVYKTIENHYCEEKLYVKIEFRISVVIIYIYFHTYVELERETPEGKSGMMDTRASKKSYT